MKTTHALTRRTVLATGTVASAGALALAACGGDDKRETGRATTAAGTAAAGAQQPPRKGGTLKAGQVTDLDFNSGHPLVVLPQNYWSLHATFEPLVRYRNSLSPELVLADRYELNADRTKLVISLKPGANFHDGSPVTPEDVFFGIDLMLEPQKFGVTGAFQLAAFAKMIAEKKKVDARTMEFTFDKPRVNITDFFAQMMITRAATFSDLRLGKNVQGTGPYMFESWTPKQSMRLKPNPNWHLTAQEGGPYLDAIELKLFADVDALGLSVESGEVEMALGAVPSVAKRFKDKGMTRVAPRRGLLYCGCNVTNPMLKDKRVRQALFLAIDRKRFTDEIGEGFGTVSVQPWPTTSPAYDKALDAPFYDPTKAKDLLKQAGFTQDRPLKIEYSSAGGGAVEQALKQNFEVIGVKIDLVPTEGNAFTAKFRARQLTDLWTSLTGFADLIPLTNFQQTFPFQVPDAKGQGGNIGYYDAPEYLDIVAKLETMDPLSPQAKEQYARFSKLWLDDPWLFPYQGREEIHIISDKLQNTQELFVTPTGSPNWGKVWKKT